MIELHPEEQVIGLYRRHWLVMVQQAVPLLILMAFPFAALFFITFPQISGIVPFTVFALSGWALFLWMTFFGLWTGYYLDVLVLTNERIIDIEQHTFFHREISECRLEQIQDVTVESHGVFAHFFRYGNLNIQTAGESERFSVNFLPNPEKVKHELSRLHLEMAHRTHTAEAELAG
jgi:hypothetical protein